MKQVFAEKLKEYEDIYPPKPEAKKWIEDSNLWLSLYTSLCLQSISADKRTVVNILEGRIMENVNMGLYGYCFRFRDVYKEMVSAVEMQASLTRKMLDSWYKELFMAEEPLHRRSNSVVYDIGFIPCHHSEIDEAMDKILRAAELSEDKAEAAALVNAGLVKIYPYGRDSVVMGLLAALFLLIKAGIPLPSYSVSEDEYCKYLSTAIAEGNPSAFMDMHYRSLLNRIDMVLNVCRQAEEASGS